MPRTLIVPGVSVEARFDVPPPLPARSGRLGAVGVVDRIPEAGVAGVTTTQELFEVFGSATRFSFPEVVSALVNGVSEVIVSPVDPGTGQEAAVTLQDDEGDDVAILRQTLLDNVDQVAPLNGTCVTRGRLNIRKALEAASDSDSDTDYESV